ncbi:MAG: NUDIX hydrolase [Firmicutes bacterium]|nr:NUDIX hydrolase [Bacillota bacterium]
MQWPTHIVAAGGFVEDKSGNILLVKTHYRGWEMPGGQIENGESIEEGVLREILEESGIIATVRCLVGVYSNVGFSHGLTKVLFDFICDYVSGEPTTSNETSEVMWVPKKDILHYITIPVFKFRFQKMLEFQNKVCYSSYVTRPDFQVLTDRYV